MPADRARAGGGFAFCLILLFGAAGIAAAGVFDLDEPYFEAVGDVDALPSRSITALAQDRSGFLWIGTQRGLVRHDGYLFQRYGTVADDPHSLSGEFVQSLLATRDGRLWVGTASDGLSVFDPGRERFVQVRHRKGDPNALGAGSIWAMAEDADGVWVGSDSGINFLRFDCSLVQAIRPHPGAATGLNPGRVLSLTVDRRGNLWIGGSDGLQRRHRDGRIERVASERGVAASRRPWPAA